MNKIKKKWLKFMNGLNFSNRELLRDFELLTLRSVGLSEEIRFVRELRTSPYKFGVKISIPIGQIEEIMSENKSNFAAFDLNYNTIKSLVSKRVEKDHQNLFMKIEYINYAEFEKKYYVIQFIFNGDDLHLIEELAHVLNEYTIDFKKFIFGEVNRYVRDRKAMIRNIKSIDFQISSDDINDDFIEIKDGLWSFKCNDYLDAQVGIEEVLSLPYMEMTSDLFFKYLLSNYEELYEKVIIRISDEILIKYRYDDNQSETDILDVLKRFKANYITCLLELPKIEKIYKSNANDLYQNIRLNFRDENIVGDQCEKTFMKVYEFLQAIQNNDIYYYIQSYGVGSVHRLKSSLKIIGINHFDSKLDEVIELASSKKINKNKEFYQCNEFFYNGTSAILNHLYYYVKTNKKEFDVYFENTKI
jgi:hypothetical protein